MRKRSRRQTREPRRVLISPEFLVEYEPSPHARVAKPESSRDDKPRQHQEARNSTIDRFNNVQPRRRRSERLRTIEHVVARNQQTPLKNDIIIDDNYSSTDEEAIRQGDDQSDQNRESVNRLAEHDKDDSDSFVAVGGNAGSNQVKAKPVQSGDEHVDSIGGNGRRAEVAKANSTGGTGKGVRFSSGNDQVDDDPAELDDEPVELDDEPAELDDVPTELKTDIEQEGDAQGSQAYNDKPEEEEVDGVQPIKASSNPSIGNGDNDKRSESDAERDKMVQKRKWKPNRRHLLAAGLMAGAAGMTLAGTKTGKQVTQNRSNATNNGGGVFSKIDAEARPGEVQGYALKEPIGHLKEQFDRDVEWIEYDWSDENNGVERTEEQNDGDRINNRPQGQPDKWKEWQELVDFLKETDEQAAAAGDVQRTGQAKEVQGQSLKPSEVREFLDSLNKTDEQAAAAGGVQRTEQANELQGQSPKPSGSDELSGSEAPEQRQQALPPFVFEDAPTRFMPDPLMIGPPRNLSNKQEQELLEFIVKDKNSIRSTEASDEQQLRQPQLVKPADIEIHGDTHSKTDAEQPTGGRNNTTESSIWPNEEEKIGIMAVGAAGAAAAKLLRRSREIHRDMDDSSSSSEDAKDDEQVSEVLGSEDVGRQAEQLEMGQMLREDQRTREVMSLRSANTENAQFFDAEEYHTDEYSEALTEPYPRSPKANELPGIHSQQETLDLSKDLLPYFNCQEKPETDAPSTKHVKYGINEIEVFEESTGSLYEAVAIGLTEHRRKGDWSPEMCEVFFMAYHSFVLHTMGGSAEDFVKFLAEANYTEESDVFDHIEKGLDNNLYIHLYNEDGPMVRDKLTTADRGKILYSIHIYLSEEDLKFMTMVEPPAPHINESVGSRSQQGIGIQPPRVDQLPGTSRQDSQELGSSQKSEDRSQQGIGIQPPLNSSEAGHVRSGGEVVVPSRNMRHDESGRDYDSGRTKSGPYDSGRTKKETNNGVHMPKFKGSPVEWLAFLDENEAKQRDVLRGTNGNAVDSGNGGKNNDVTVQQSQDPSSIPLPPEDEDEQFFVDQDKGHQRQNTRENSATEMVAKNGGAPDNSASIPSPADKILLYTLKGCPPCERQKKVIRKILEDADSVAATTYRSLVTEHHVDGEDASQAASDNGVESFPSWVVQNEISGFKNEDEVRKMLRDQYFSRATSKSETAPRQHLPIIPPPKLQPKLQRRRVRQNPISSKIQQFNVLDGAKRDKKDMDYFKEYKLTATVRKYDRTGINLHRVDFANWNDLPFKTVSEQMENIGRLIIENPKYRPREGIFLVHAEITSAFNLMKTNAWEILKQFVEHNKSVMVSWSEEGLSFSSKPLRVRNFDHDRNIVSFAFENLVVQYELETYTFDPIKVLPANGFYDAVAISLARSAEKWRTIQRGETNLCALMHEKLTKYSEKTGADVVVDHNFIKWMVRDFVENEASSSFHAVYQCPHVNFHEIREVIRQRPTHVSQETNAVLVQFALRDVVTVVQPGTPWLGSKMYTTGDDKAFIFVTNKHTFQLSGHFMMTVDELRASPLLNVDYARHMQPRRKSRGKDGAYPALSFTYKGKTRDIGRMKESVVAGDGNCFYRAIAVCLNGQRKQWASIRNDETDLESVLTVHLRRYKSTSEQSTVIRHDFLRWLVADTLVHASDTHEMFRHFPSHYTNDLTFANKDALVNHVRGIGTDGYAGSIEGIVLHHALRKLVSIVAVSKKENILVYSEVMSRGDNDKSFMFLLQLHGNHWNPLMHSSTRRFLWKLQELEQVKELPDKCVQTEAIKGSPDTQYVKYGSGAIKIYRPNSGTLFEAVAISLAEQRRAAEWSKPMCSEMQQAYYDFLLQEGNSRRDEWFVEFLARKGYNENMKSGDVFHQIERGLNDNIYIHLYNKNGPLPRDKARRTNHVSITYLIHLYIYYTPEGQKYAAIQFTI